MCRKRKLKYNIVCTLFTPYFDIVCTLFQDEPYLHIICTLFQQDSNTISTLSQHSHFTSGVMGDVEPSILCVHVKPVRKQQFLHMVGVDNRSYGHSLAGAYITNRTLTRHKHTPRVAQFPDGFSNASILKRRHHIHNHNSHIHQT